MNHYLGRKYTIIQRLAKLIVDRTLDVAASRTNSGILISTYKNAHHKS